MVLVACMPNAALAEYSCGPTPKICKIFLDAKAVFTGKVISVDQTHGLVRLQVQESFKGLPQGTKEVWIDPEWSGPGAWIEDPGPQYRVGEEWLVFAAEFTSKSWEARFRVTNFDFANKPRIHRWHPLRRWWFTPAKLVGGELDNDGTAWIQRRQAASAWLPVV
jgi:hypothetical protein